MDDRKPAAKNQQLNNSDGPPQRREENADSSDGANPLVQTKKLKFRSSGYIREAHKLGNAKKSQKLHVEPHPIYCLSWSKEMFVERGGSSSNCKQDQEVAIKPSPTSAEDSQIRSRTKNRYFRCFASVAGPYATIYEVEIPDPNTEGGNTSSSGSSSGTIKLKQAYVDPDKKESFYTCAFGGKSCYIRSMNMEETIMETNDEAKQSQNGVTDSNSDTGGQLLCVAGTAGTIKIIDPVRLKLVMALQGHGNEVYDLQFSPTDEGLLLSASLDSSCRLWNLKNGTSIAIFSGHEGHRDSVVSATWHCSGGVFVSGSIDTRVKIWDIAKGENGRMIQEKIKASNAIQLQQNQNGIYEPETYFKPFQCQFPIFSTNKVHYNTVDCVRFTGDIVITKSINQIVMWLPIYPENSSGKITETPSEVLVLRTFEVEHVNLWFYRFTLDPLMEDTLAVGNQRGDILLWNLGQENDEPNRKLGTSKHCGMIRNVSFSPDGKTLICCCDDGKLYKWDVY